MSTLSFCDILWKLNRTDAFDSGRKNTLNVFGTSVIKLSVSVNLFGLNFKEYCCLFVFWVRLRENGSNFWRNPKAKLQDIYFGFFVDTLESSKSFWHALSTAQYTSYRISFCVAKELKASDVFVHLFMWFLYCSIHWEVGCSWSYW